MSTEAALSRGARGEASAFRADRMVLAMLALGLAAVFVPTYAELARTTWASDEQGQGPIILAACAWLFWMRASRIAALPEAAPSTGGWWLLGFGLALHWLGHAQEVLMFATAAQIPVLAGLLWIFKGRAAARLCTFPLFFLLFMVPLPGPFVAALTAPLKSAVSQVAADVLYALGYPIGRSGVVLQVGQYQMLVADACAGLTSIFTLEALGLLYMEIKGHASALRRALLVVLLIPIAFCANVVRVLVLVLITYHFGNAAGQGFAHDFAGIVLFLAATVFMMIADAALGLFFRTRGSAR